VSCGQVPPVRVVRPILLKRVQEGGLRAYLPSRCQGAPPQPSPGTPTKVCDPPAMSGRCPFAPGLSGRSPLNRSEPFARQRPSSRPPIVETRPTCVIQYGRAGAGDRREPRRSTQGSPMHRGASPYRAVSRRALPGHGGQTQQGAARVATAHGGIPGRAAFAWCEGHLHRAGATAPGFWWPVSPNVRVPPLEWRLPCI